MALHDINEISDALKYRDYYLLEEDEMGDNSAQGRLIKYLVDVLEWYYKKQGWFIAYNLNFYHPLIDNPKNQIVPDVAVFKDIEIPAEEQANMGSWNMMQGDKPCAPWVFESSSEDTYANDIFPDRKVRLYGLIGAREYFAYDPNFPQVWPKRTNGRLLGWKYDHKGNPNPIRSNDNGWLWSEVLESWLVPDGRFLRLYDRDENLRLTEVEAETKARQEAEKQAKAEANRAKAEAKARQEAEKQAKAEANRAASEEKARHKAEKRAVSEEKARQALEKQVADLQRQLEELRRNKDTPQ